MKRFLKYVLYAFLAALAVLVAMNIFVPVYVFDEPRPFHGEYLHNPYQDMDSTAWKCCNFHGHTAQYGGVTNGRVNGNAVYDSMYRLFEYDHIGISDYNKINDYELDKDESFIPAYEHGWNIWKIHQLCLGAEKVRRVDYFFGQTLSMKQHTINKLGEQNKAVCVAHPAFVEGGYNPEDFKYLSNYRIMEVLNGFENSPAHWDNALSNGHLVYLIADDDTHNVFVVNDIALRITYVNAKDNDAETLLENLLAGNAYGIDFDLDRSETMEDKVARFKRDMPYLQRAQLVGNQFDVRVSKPIRKARFLGQGGMILQDECFADSTFEIGYEIQPTDTYVRTEITFFDGTMMWLNPVTRHEGENIVCQRLDHISWLWTAALWTAWVLLLTVVVKIVKKEKSH